MKRIGHSLFIQNPYEIGLTRSRNWLAFSELATSPNRPNNSKSLGLLFRYLL